MEEYKCVKDPPRGLDARGNDAEPPLLALIVVRSIDAHRLRSLCYVVHDADCYPVGCGGCRGVEIQGVGCDSSDEMCFVGFRIPRFVFIFTNCSNNLKTYIYGRDIK